MTTYEFTLLFALQEKARAANELVDALYEAGCDDAVVGLGNPKLIVLEFAREAATAMEAMQSAIGDVRKAIPGARLIEAKPDLVSLSEIAEVMGCTRQNMRKYAIGQIRAIKQPFPAPAYTGSPSLWHLCEVAQWAASADDLKISSSLAELSRQAHDININVRAGQKVQLVADSRQSLRPRRAGSAPSVLEALRLHKRSFRALPEHRVLTSAERQFTPVYAGIG